jgi:hypothetical protein
LCTVVVGFEPHADVPVVLVGVRDELADRHWEGPGEHWPDHPGVLGGRDLQAGGTWLAVDPAARRVAALLNGRGTLAPAERRVSRGGLPIAAVAADRLPDTELSRYDPFHLVLADPRGVRLWRWDGEAIRADHLPPGTHMVVNAGWLREPGNPRTDHFLPRFAAAPRPKSIDGRAPADYWGEWLGLAAGAGLPPGAPDALIVRAELPDGRIWGTSSVTLLALSPAGVRYDFSARPADPAAFRTVLPQVPTS